jgi:hypothetical protein
LAGPMVLQGSQDHPAGPGQRPEGLARRITRGP